MSEADGKYPDEVVAFARVMLGIHSLQKVYDEDWEVGGGPIGQLRGMKLMANDLPRARVVKVHGLHIPFDRDTEWYDWKTIADQPTSWES